MYRFLLSPKWIAALLGVLLGAATMVWLGDWQLDRWQQKREVNAAISAAIEADPVPAGSVVPRDATVAVPTTHQWRRVVVRGEYLPDKTVVIRQRAFGDGIGLEVVVPLAAQDGQTYLISRGYVLVSGGADEVPQLPEPPSGEVEVIGWVRPTSKATDTAATGVTVIDGVRSVRVLKSAVLQGDLAEDLAAGYIQTTAESPAAAEISRIPLPDRDDGPHLSYAIQWFIFAAITVLGFGYLARREGYERLLAEEELDEYGDDELEEAASATAS